MLDHLLPQIAVMVYAMRVSIELQHSREKLVITREEERRKIRDELHDVIGSKLAIMPIMLDLAATGDADERDRLLALLKGQIQEIIQEIQRFIKQLRPVSLDQLGLLGAIRQLADEVNDLNQMKVWFTVPRASFQLPALSEAAEIAAFRIVHQALTNVVRHARATECRIILDIRDNELCIAIQDNGCGIAPGAQLGVGINSMRERAAELGGSFNIQSSAGTGTHLVVRLPLYVATE